MTLDQGLQASYRWDAMDLTNAGGFKKSGLKLANILISCIYKVSTWKLKYLPHRNKIFVKILALQKHLNQDAAHQWDVQKCLADKVSSIFGSNLVVPIIKIDFKC
jgi:hypothetical protein